MRRITRDTGKIAPPPKPNIMRPEYDERGVLVPPPSPTVVSDHYRCLAAYVNREDIPIDEGLLENAADTVIKWCRKVEAPQNPAHAVRTARRQNCEAGRNPNLMMRSK